MINLIKENIKKTNPELLWIIDNLVFLHYGGSILYGLNNSDSDIDLIGITYAPMEYWVGARNFDQINIKSEIDGKKVEITIYDVRKWCKLAFGTNPNIIESLYVNQPCVIHGSYAWETIQKAMLKCMNKNAFKGFLGYSTSQMHKMQIKQDNKTGRREIVDKYGMDVKFASHAFRLCGQGTELLNAGKITFPRPNADFLKKVKYGKIYNKAEHISMCLNDLEKEIGFLKFAYEHSKLPSGPDFNVYNTLLQEFFLDYVLKN